MKKIFQRAILWIVSIFICHQANAFGTTIAMPRSLPENVAMDQIDVELYTVGVGPELYMRYGHTLLGFFYKETGKRYIYNWGMFSFDDPAFPLKFYLGKRTYWVGETSIEGVIRLYRDYEDRDVWRDIIQLTQQQKKRLLQAVNNSLTEKNMFFNYEHFERNCSTIPRDLIDFALNGYPSRELVRQNSEHDYRWYVRTHMGSVPALAWALDIAMNSKLDANISAWQESFYPLKLREYLTGLPAIDDNGNVASHIALLADSQQLVHASKNWIVSDPHFFLSATFFLGAMLLLLIFFNKDFTRYFAAPILGLIFGTLGLSMLVSWVFSTHYDMHHNVNLLIFFPTDYVLLAGWWVVKKTWFRYYVLLHMIFFLLHSILTFSGISHQDTSQVNILGLFYVICLMLISGILTREGVKIRLKLNGAKT